MNVRDPIAERGFDTFFLEKSLFPFIRSSYSGSKSVRQKAQFPHIGGGLPARAYHWVFEGEVLMTAYDLVLGVKIFNALYLHFSRGLVLSFDFVKQMVYSVPEVGLLAIVYGDPKLSSMLVYYGGTVDVLANSRSIRTNGSYLDSFGSSLLISESGLRGNLVVPYLRIARAGHDRATNLYRIDDRMDPSLLPEGYEAIRSSLPQPRALS
ncbi:hypothetical protein VNO77_44194 [Canavalia gladiata]|uniref:Uncharacterized protein n=1 Tax=Canavalia gladiata TaxID=3824 RepID=A0AAN9JXT6_CANGL